MAVSNHEKFVKQLVMLEKVLLSAASCMPSSAQSSAMTLYCQAISQHTLWIALNTSRTDSWRRDQLDLQERLHPDRTNHVAPDALYVLAAKPNQRTREKQLQKGSNDNASRALWAPCHHTTNTSFDL